MRGLTLLFWTLIFTGLNVELMQVQAEDKFAYSRKPPNGTTEIYVVDGEGGEPTQLTDDWRWNRWPAWSADGNLLAFIASGTLAVMEADGKNQRNVAAGAFFRPAWSPNGRQIAVMKGLSLWIFDVETLEGKEIHGTQVSMSPTWSPDGRQIAFRSDLFAEGNWDIYLMDINIGANLLNPRRLTVDLEDDHYPAWSPDGSEIAFSSDRSGQSQIYVMNMIGRKKIRQLTDLPFSGQRSCLVAGREIKLPLGDGKVMTSNLLGFMLLMPQGGQPTLRIPTGHKQSSHAWGKGPVRFAVDPREKLTTTWGAIKKRN